MEDNHAPTALSLISPLICGFAEEDLLWSVDQTSTWMRSDPRGTTTRGCVLSRELRMSGRVLSKCKIKDDQQESVSRRSYLHVRSRFTLFTWCYFWDQFRKNPAIISWHLHSIPQQESEARIFYQKRHIILCQISRLVMKCFTHTGCCVIECKG